jgi:hypothetical protein
MLRKLMLAGVVGLTIAAAAAPAPAGARSLPNKIVLYKSIGAISLGTTPAQIKHKLGKPSQTTRVSGKIAGLIYYNDQLSFDFDTLHPGDPADLVGAIGGAFHTSKGIHVGSPAKAVRRAYHGIKCKNALCTLYEGTPGSTGERQTDFSTFGGKVESIDVQEVFSP